MLLTHSALFRVRAVQARLLVSRFCLMETELLCWLNNFKLYRVDQYFVYLALGDIKADLSKKFNSSSFAPGQLMYYQPTSRRNIQ